MRIVEASNMDSTNIERMIPRGAFNDSNTFPGNGEAKV